MCIKVMMILSLFLSTFNTLCILFSVFNTLETATKLMSFIYLFFNIAGKDPICIPFSTVYIIMLKISFKEETNVLL